MLKKAVFAVFSLLLALAVAAPWSSWAAAMSPLPGAPSITSTSAWHAGRAASRNRRYRQGRGAADRIVAEFFVPPEMGSADLLVSGPSGFTQPVLSPPYHPPALPA